MDIEVTDANEAPEFSDAAKAQTTMTMTEVVTDDGTVDDLDGNADEATNQATFAAVDPDTVNVSDDVVSYSLEGDDAKYFTLAGGNGNELAAKGDDTTTTEDETLRPNFEEKSSYAVTVVATSGTGDRTLRSKLNITVNVTDAEDTGTVTLSQREPQIGQTRSGLSY